MGLDRDDTVIRRRLRQKLEFLVDDAGRTAPPTDAELQAWLDRHPDVVPAGAAGRAAPGLRQPGERRDDRPGGRREAARPAARRGRRRDDRRARRPDACCRRSCRSVRSREVARTFGDELRRGRRELAGASGAVPSSRRYGLHLVLVPRAHGPRAAGARARCVLSSSASSWPSASGRELAELYEGLLAKYTVTIEMPRSKAPPRRRRRGAARGEPSRSRSRRSCLVLARAAGACAHEARPASSSCARRARAPTRSSGRSRPAARSRSRSRRSSRRAAGS